jgi:Trk K+ transport system NAD-binding subunit
VFGIRRGNKEIIPKGNTLIYSSDYILVLVNENIAACVKEELIEMGGKPGL